MTGVSLAHAGGDGPLRLRGVEYVDHQERDAEHAGNGPGLSLGDQEGDINRGLAEQEVILVGQGVGIGIVKVEIPGIPEARVAGSGLF